MSDASIAASVETIPLRRGRGSVAFHETGFRAPQRLARDRFTDYRDVTHLQIGSRALRIGTRTAVITLPRAAFISPTGIERVQRLLVERIALLPDGAMQLFRFAELDQRVRAQPPVAVVGLTALLCAAFWLAEWFVGPSISFAGFFSRTLVLAGEWWRLITANLLHGGALHLATNALVLIGIGSLVERPLGAARTFFIVVVSALAAMGAGLEAGYEQAVGASGIAAGLVGAALTLELRSPDRLPVQWRLPRRWLLAAIAAEAGLSLFVSFIAAASHAAGFVTGFLACAVVSPPALQRRPASIPLFAANVFFAGLVALALGTMTREVLGGTDVVARRAERLLRLPDVDPELLNNTAWTIATAGNREARALELALELAERAVRETESRDPSVLDTLAEAHFQLGHSEQAIAAIDAAIRLAPGEPYFREQRRRFTGERAADDRPSEPQSPDFPALPRDSDLPDAGGEDEQWRDDDEHAWPPDDEPDEPESEDPGESEGPIAI